MAKWASLPWRGPHDLPLPYLLTARRQAMEFSRRWQNSTPVINRTLKEVGWEWGVSGERVRQIINGRGRFKAASPAEPPG